MPTTETIPEPLRDKKGATVLWPRNLELDRQNPDILRPPSTDRGTMPNLKWSFSLSHNRLEEGGWARQVTTREMPISTAMAGVDMRLEPGCVREMHWHKQAEWAYMLVGSARVTSVDENGRNFADDIQVGDLWYFPSGIPHSIQALEEGCEFLLVFNDGSFSEDSTFLVTDMLAHLPKEVVAANFGVPAEELTSLPKKERYIFPAKLPPKVLAEDQVADPQGPAPRTFSHRLTAQAPLRSHGGSVRIVDSRNFPVSTHIAAALVEVEPGGMRALHWHPNSDEWQYYISGQARMTVFASGAKARTFDYQAGDVGYVPVSMPHYVQNTGTETLRFLEVFASDHYADVTVNQWLALTPPELVQQTLEVEVDALRGLQKTKRPII